MKRVYSLIGWSIICFFTLSITSLEENHIMPRKEIVIDNQQIGFLANTTIADFNGSFAYFKNADINQPSIEEQNPISSKENVAPVPDLLELPTLLSECNVVVTPPSATNYEGARILAFTDDPVVYSKQGSYSVEWKYVDEKGNVTIQTQKVIIDDVSALKPEVMALPVLEGACQVTATPPSAYDNCIGTVQAITSDPLVYSKVGQHKILWVYKDGNGNETYQEQRIIVSDSIFPKISAPDDIEVKIRPEEIFAGNINLGEAIATDNCSVVLVSNNAPESFPIGETKVTWEAVDKSGNKSMVNQIVRVIVMDEMDFSMQKRQDLDREIEPGNFALYPNPASQLANIYVPLLSNETTVTIEVFDESGRSVYNSIFKKNSSFEHQIPVENLSAGVYMVSITTGNLINSKRLIKK